MAVSEDRKNTKAGKTKISINIYMTYRYDEFQKTTKREEE